MESWPSSSAQTAIPLQTNVAQANSPIGDNIRFAIIDAVNVRPGIWDTSREKINVQTKRNLFIEVTEVINRQFGLNPPLLVEEVEKTFKNLKDTYVKTRKKISFNCDGSIIRPKWKFFDALLFLDIPLTQVNGSIGLKRSFPREQFQLMDPIAEDVKRIKNEESDEFMTFCRSLYHPLKEIAHKDRIQYLKLQKTIIDLIHNTQMDVLTKVARI
ncbi:unnamed protein product [Caenorhabditis angaria]|uniref:MADF domain-containing protein n=1 Tax=Caenorhabditis angaria TaxID=860376 RepID=A0A9P1I846_9PELO|nr:unnamed protein product [Caenorhabditis angaria]